jgi:glutamyl-tRNA reductase
MRIICLGLSHHTAPIELRERLNYPPQAVEAALARFADAATRPAGLSELVILSTCNRLELYAALPGSAADDIAAGHRALERFVAETHAPPLDELSDRFYRLEGQAASEHLGRVACGLDSMILGEPQILGQVNDAHALAHARGAAGPILSALFRAAVHAGKRARAETAISRHPATLSSVAVRVAEQVAGPLPAQRVVIVGAGEMAQLAVEALHARGARRITVVNRTPARATTLADRWGGRGLPLDHLRHALADADVVVTATGAPHFIITAELVAEALAGRPQRPLLLMDIAVPRDVDPAARALPGVRYFDLDSLEAFLHDALAERQQAVPQVEAIAAGEMARFGDWLAARDVAPVIAGLHAKAEAIRRAEVDKTLRHLPNLTPAERQHIESLAEALVNKLLQAPTGRLKAEAGNGHAAEYAAAARALFGLDD